MDFSGPGLTYVLLVIPTLFALVVTAQGAAKVSKHDPSGPIILGFGVLFLILIAGVYFFVIR